MGLVWKYVNDVTYLQLVPNWDGINLGRSKVKVEEAAMEYAAREEAGSMPPAPVLRETSDGFDPLDGIQRLLAKQLLSCTRFSAYIVTVESELLAKEIRIFANSALNGCHGESSQWTRRQAIQHLVIEGGMSCEEVARKGGWKLADVEDDRLYLDTDFKLRCIGAPEGLSKSLVLNIAEVMRPDDLKQAAKPIAEFCADLKRGHFTNGDAKPYVQAFFSVPRTKGKVHDHFAEALDDFRKQPDVKTRMEGRVSSRRNPDIQLRASMKSVLTTIDRLVATEEEIRYLDEFFHLANQIKSGLTKLARGPAVAKK